MIRLRTRRDAIIWQAVDKVFAGEDARTVCAELELDLIRAQAERLLNRHDRHDRHVALLRETDPARIPARKAAA